MSNIEQKLDMILKQVNKIDSIATQVASNAEAISSLDMKLNNTKQELIDKLASKEKVDDHELRISNIEEKVF